MDEYGTEAFFAHLAYASPQDRQQMINNDLSSNDYSIDTSFNDDEHFIAVHNDTGHVISAFRGTSNLDDVGTDLALAVGNLTSTDRYQRDIQRARRVHSKYSDSHILSVGHSLGGTLAEQTSRELGHSSVVFNPGTSPFMEDQAVSQVHQRIRTSNDIVSAFGAATTTLQPTQSSPLQSKFSDLASYFGIHSTSYRPVAERIHSSYLGHFLSQFGDF